MTPAFVGFVIVALVGGAAEMAAAFSGARSPPSLIDSVLAPATVIQSGAPCVNEALSGGGPPETP
jgi:Ca2+/H+ antiporter